MLGIDIMPAGSLLPATASRGELTIFAHSRSASSGSQTFCSDVPNIFASSSPPASRSAQDSFFPESPRVDGHFTIDPDLAKEAIF